MARMHPHKRVCIFVDGENLRHSIGSLFPSFDKRTYLPRTKWDAFFDWISCQAAGDDAVRVRTYWYAVQNIDFAPFNLNAAEKDPKYLEEILFRNPEAKKHILGASTPEEKEKLTREVVDELKFRQSKMEKRFGGWIRMQDAISTESMALEFRRAGYIRYDLFDEKLGKEKAVDVKLATDLIRFKDIYDVAVIVSGDQDYVPAVELIKDAGKRVVGVAFKQEDGRLLPGGAKRLNQATDWGLEIEHDVLKSHLGL